MVYTVTFNPSLDYYMYFVGLAENGLPDRSHDCRFSAGGKGINVSRVLSALGVENVALGFCGGFSGDELMRLLEKEGLCCDFVQCEDNTRINVKTVFSQTGKTGEFNASGAEISKENAQKLINKLSKVKKGDIVAVCGSTPYCNIDLYKEACAKATENGALVIADTTGKTLLSCAEQNVFLVKPNVYELAQIFSGSVEEGAKKLIKAGCQNVLVSAGENGAVLAGGHGIIKCPVPEKMRVFNTVGAGDSMLAGYIYGYVSKYGKEDCLKSAVCAGSAAAYGKNGFTKEAYEELFKKAKTEAVQ